MKLAICYDRVNKFGGAERVLQALHELFPDAPLFTLTATRENADWANNWEVRTSFLQKIPFIGTKHELFPPLAALAWEQFRFDAFDVVISVTSAEAKSILVSPQTIHICYCLTPTRYYWSGYYDYVKSPGLGLLSGIAKRVFPFFAYLLRPQDFIHAQRPDVMVGISEEVCTRIKKYYRRDSFKIYPPVKIQDTRLKTKDDKKRYFLVVSRLVPYKRVDIVIDAFTHLGWPLVIVGTGSQKESLQARAGKNIEFKGFVSDEELDELYGGACGLIFPTFEDFGIVPVEAQARGVPVIAFGTGGAAETVINGQTGVFFDQQTAESLEQALLALGSTFESAMDKLDSFSDEDLIGQAQTFSKDRFLSLFADFVQNTYTQNLNKKPKSAII